MKLDFYSPKNYYSSHVLALSGYVFLFFYICFNPYKGPVCDYGGLGGYIIMLGLFVDSILIALFIYILEIFFKSKVKNTFLLKNQFYDFIFDLGLTFYLLPLIWLTGQCSITPFIFLILIFISIRLIKIYQKKSEKRDINET